MALWKFLCEKYLKRQLHEEYKALNKLNVNYLSSYKDDVKEFFKRKITWEEAIDLCTDMGTGFSDAMILKMWSCQMILLIKSCKRGLHSI
jgi:hypothetical protein